jgi:hypothetical protein
MEDRLIKFTTQIYKLIMLTTLVIVIETLETLERIVMETVVS